MGYNIIEKMKSDKGAAISVEMIVLIALAVFAVLAIAKFIMDPLEKSAKGIGDTITEMNPRP